MSVIVPIERIRLGNSEVETPGLTLKVTNVLRGENAVLGFLDGGDDLIISVLKARNGKANIGDQWIKFEIRDLGNQVEVRCDETIKITDIFALLQNMSRSYV